MTAQRARTIEELTALQAGMLTTDGLRRGLALQLRPTDVVISPFAKCGTTWLQQIVHSLRTRGDMDFDDISRVVPWIETSYDLGLDLEAEQVAPPRAFKSHLPWDTVPKGGRYLVSLRDPGDALVSAFRFMEGWFLEPGTVSISDFAVARFFDRRGGHDYWSHLLSWWPRRHDANVLLLTYEDMRADLPRAVRQIASFVGIPLDDQLLSVVVEHASFDFMNRHKDRFDDHLMRERSEQVAGLPPGSNSAKVRTGQVGSHRIELPEDVQRELQRVWHNVVDPELGFGSYSVLLEALRAERG